MYDHFSTIASKYQSVRTLDTKPIRHIKEKLAQKEKIIIYQTHDKKDKPRIQRKKKQTIDPKATQKISKQGPVKNKVAKRVPDGPQGRKNRKIPNRKYDVQ